MNDGVVFLIQCYFGDTEDPYLASVNNLFLALYFCTTNVIRTGIVHVANALSP